VANEYASISTLRDRLGLADSGEDAEFARVLESASRAVDGVCGRRFWQDTTATARTLTTTLNQACVEFPPGWDISTTTGLVVTSSAGTWTLGTHFQLRPDGGVGPTGEAWPYTSFHGVDGQALTMTTWSMSITARWGWPGGPPPAVVEATLILAADYWKLKDAPFGVAGFGDMGVVRVRQNARALELLAPYRHGRALVGVA
jgi:hypothetical protein